MVPTLKDLTNIRAQVAEGLDAYLQSFVDLSAWQGKDKLPAFLFLPDGFPQERAPNLYQPPDVVDRTRFNDEARVRRQKDDAAGVFRHGEEARDARVAWVVERRRIRCAAILGRPGEGKTLLTQLTCRKVARTSLAALRRRSRPLAEIPLPLWLRFEDVLRAGSLKDAVAKVVPDMVAEAVKAYMKRTGRPLSPGPATTWLLSALERKSTWLFLDALDERGRQEGQTESVHPQAAIADLSALPEGIRVVMTCRLHEYNKTELRTTAIGNLVEYELEPLSPAQQRRFVGTWFSRNPAKVSKVQDLVGRHPQFQDMATNGLMLTLICTTAEHNDIDPERTRRVHLYELILRDMVRRARRLNPLQLRDPSVGRRLRVLRQASHSLFTVNPEQPSLREEKWDDEVLKACEQIGIPDGAQFAAGLTRDVREGGLLVSHKDGFLRFLHRSFYDYLAASHVAGQGAAATIATIEAHVSEPRWREVSVMALGHLGLVREEVADAGAVVDDIIRRQPGSSGEAVVLMGDAIVDAGKDCVPEGTLQRLRDALLRVMRNDHVPAKVRAAAGSALGRLGDHRFHDESLWCLPKLQSDPGPDGRLEPEPLLGFIEIPEGEFWMGSDP